MAYLPGLPSTEESDEQSQQQQITPVTTSEAAGQTAQKNFFQQASDTAAEFLGLRSEEESEVLRAQGLEQTSALTQQIAEDDSVLAEIGKGIAGAPANLGTKALGAAEFVGDVVGGVADAAGVVDRAPEDIPWSEQYEYASYDIGSAQTNTWYGGLIQEALSFVIGGSVTGGLAARAGAGAIAQSGVAVASDFVLDYFSDADGGNISNLIQDGPLANHLSAALAHQDEDNAHIRRIKNALEGAIPGVAIEAFQGFYRGLRAGNAVNGTPEVKAEVAQQVARQDPQGPTADAARAENTANSGRPATDVEPERPAQYDPQDRVSQVDKTDVNESAASFWDSPEPGGGRSMVDEVDISTIKTQAGLRDYIQARIPDVDVDSIVRRLGRQEPEYVNDVLTSVKSVADRISVLSKEVTSLAELDAPFRTQATQILDRAEALVRLKKEATQFSSKNLENWKEVPPNLRKAIARDNEKITQVFGELRDNLNSSNAADFLKGKEDLSKLGMAFAATGGDAKLQMSIIEGVARVGWKRVNSVFINSILSGPLTNLRNLGGNTVAIGERVFSRAIGGEGLKSFRAFDGFYETVSESLSIARQSMGSPYSVVTDSSKVVDYAIQDRKVLENAVNAAQTSGEKAAASWALKVFDFTNNPWFTWPGRALQAGDDLTKSILARMELRFEAAKEAAEAVKTLKPGDQLKTADDYYRALKDQKLSPGGKILDHDLLDISESATFQRPLQGWAKTVGSSVQGAPGGRIIMPFYKTGHNITRYAVQISPLAPLSSEFREVMEFGTEAQKAVMRGRMATGYMVVTAAAGLASADLLTGYGPPPGKERDDWLKSHVPNSVRIGDKWVSYQAIPGISLVASTVADVTNMVGEMSEGDAAYVMGALPFFVANAITSQPMFQGFLSVSEILDPRGWAPERIAESAGSFANDLVGGSSLRRSLENALATNMSDYKNWAQAAIGKLSGGLLGEKVERIDVLTGKPMPTKYANYFNLINPFTVVGKDKSPLLDSLGQIDFPIGAVIPRRVGGVELTPEERAFVGEQIYAEGNFPKSLQATLASKGFWDKYETWQQQRRDGIAVPKEESAWYMQLSRTVSSYRQSALLALREGSGPVSQNYRATYAGRAARLGSGAGGGLSPAEQGTIREINELARWGKGVSMKKKQVQPELDFEAGVISDDLAGLSEDIA